MYVKVANPVGAVGDVNAPIGDDDGVFAVLFGHVSAPVCAILIVLDQHIHRVIVGINGGDVQGGRASAASIHGELCPLVHSDTCLLKARACGNHLINKKQKTII